MTLTILLLAVLAVLKKLLESKEEASLFLHASCISPKNQALVVSIVKFIFSILEAIL